MAAFSLQVSLPTQYNGKNQNPVGALSGTLARLQANRPLRELREIAKGVTKQLPEAIQARALLMRSSLRFPLPLAKQVFRATSSMPCCAWGVYCSSFF